MLSEIRLGQFNYKIKDWILICHEKTPQQAYIKSYRLLDLLYCFISLKFISCPLISVKGLTYISWFMISFLLF